MRGLDTLLSATGTWSVSRQTVRARSTQRAPQAETWGVAGVRGSRRANGQLPTAREPWRNATRARRRLERARARARTGPAAAWRRSCLAPHASSEDQAGRCRVATRKRRGRDSVAADGLRDSSRRKRASQLRADLVRSVHRIGRLQQRARHPPPRPAGDSQPREAVGTQQEAKPHRRVCGERFESRSRRRPRRRARPRGKSLVATLIRAVWR